MYDESKKTYYSPLSLTYEITYGIKMDCGWVKECRLEENELTSGGDKRKRIQRSSLKKEVNIAKHKTALLTDMLSKLKQDK